MSHCLFMPSNPYLLLWVHSWKTYSKTCAPVCPPCMTLGRAEVMRKRERYEAKHSGGFSRIYPTSDRTLQVSRVACHADTCMPLACTCL